MQPTRQERVEKLDVAAILLVALGLSMDCFAVSIANGVSAKALRIENALRIAVSFGAFQAFMPVLGWAAGLTLIDLIAGFDHWAAFLILSLIGGKMIYEATKMKGSERRATNLNTSVLLMLSLATSIDALAIGLSFSFLKVSIVTPTAVIGIVTFLLSFLGVSFGRRIGHLFENRIEAAGGLILIAIGAKILVEHML